MQSYLDGHWWRPHWNSHYQVDCDLFTIFIHHSIQQLMHVLFAVVIWALAHGMEDDISIFLAYPDTFSLLNL